MTRRRVSIFGRAFGATATAIALAVAVPHTAHAHTHIVLAGNQIVGGGEVNGYGRVDNVVINDGPASDGTVIFTNLDPVQHRLVGDLTVVVPPGAQVEITLPTGTYDFHDEAQPSMRGRVRVTGSH